MMKLMAASSKRNSSGSPSLQIPMLKKSREKSPSPPPPDESVQLLLRIYGHHILKTYVMEIEPDDLKKFSQSRSYVHDHAKLESDGRFCDVDLKSESFDFISALPNAYPECYVALLGSTVYSVFFHGLPSQSLDFKSIDLNEDPDLSEDEKWVTLPPPPCELLPDGSCHPKLFSLRDRLYFFGAFNHPALLVFNPATTKWSKLDGPPNIDLNLAFKASLGEEHGKFLFFHYDVQPDASFICIFDVTTATWASYPATPFVGGGHAVFDRFTAGNAVVNRQESTTIYWLHNLHGKVFAFDWKNMRLSSGPITGMDADNVVRLIKNNHMSFCHVQGHIFCLFWHVRPSPLSLDDTHIHLTFLRVVNDGNLLTAYVVGCHRLSLTGTWSAYEASLL